MDLNEVLTTKKGSTQTLTDFVVTKLEIQHCSKDIIRCVEKVVRTFRSNLEKRLKQCSRKKDRFLRKDSEWLVKSMDHGHPPPFPLLFPHAWPITPDSFFSPLINYCQYFSKT